MEPNNTARRWLDQSESAVRYPLVMKPRNGIDPVAIFDAPDVQRYCLVCRYHEKNYYGVVLFSFGAANPIATIPPIQDLVDAKSAAEKLVEEGPGTRGMTRDRMLQMVGSRIDELIAAGFSQSCAIRRLCEDLRLTRPSSVEAIRQDYMTWKKVNHKKD